MADLLWKYCRTYPQMYDYSFLFVSYTSHAAYLIVGWILCLSDTEQVAEVMISGDKVDALSF